MKITDLIIKEKTHTFLEKKHLAFFSKITSNNSFSPLYQKIISLPNSPTEVLYHDDLVELKNEIFSQPSFSDLLLEFSPWRKGPYLLTPHNITSEWNSHFKWQRIKKKLANVEGKVVLDLGCNNGYFMFRLLPLNPSFVIGLDPVAIFYLQFLLLNQFFNSTIIDFSLLGHQDLFFFDDVFDVVLCLGILYHHPDPLGILKQIFRSLRKGGMVIIDSQGIKSDDSFCLFPEDKYLGKNNFWFLPSVDCLKNWLKRIGFKEIDVFYEEPLSFQEQRKTSWANASSLLEGVQDNQKTIEGYPYPYRFYLSAYK